MNHLKLFILFIGFGICSYEQVTESDLIGDWKVKRVVQKPSNPELRGVLEGFKSATFSFSENGDFDLTTESKAPTFQMILRMTQDSEWKFDSGAQLIKIGSEEDGYSIMGIYPTLQNEVMQFALDESAMTFEMEKAKN